MSCVRSGGGRRFEAEEQQPLPALPLTTPDRRTDGARRRARHAVPYRVVTCHGGEGAALGGRAAGEAWAGGARLLAARGVRAFEHDFITGELLHDALFWHVVCTMPTTTCDTLPAIDCSRGFRASEASAASAALRMCGFVVLRSALSQAHVAQLTEAYVRHEPTLAAADLRDGRKEQLLPFAPPFTDNALLHSPVWTEVAAEYLGATELALDALTAVLAPLNSPAQALHRDVHAGPAAVLSVQIPLVDLPRGGGGALVLQPASHLAPEVECNATALPSPVEVSMTTGSAIVYDARLCHYGSANTVVAGVRPVLYLLLRKTDLGTTSDGFPYTTGYEPLELMLRHGGGATGGLGTVQRYRRAFRWKRAARLGSNRSADESEEPEEEEGSMLLFPLRALSAYTSEGFVPHRGPVRHDPRSDDDSFGALNVNA
jgi:hypothetical protein